MDTLQSYRGKHPTSHQPLANLISHPKELLQAFDLVAKASQTTNASLQSLLDQNSHLASLYRAIAKQTTDMSAFATTVTPLAMHTDTLVTLVTLMDSLRYTFESIPN